MQLLSHFWIPYIKFIQGHLHKEINLLSAYESPQHSWDQDIEQSFSLVSAAPICNGLLQRCTDGL